MDESAEDGSGYFLYHSIGMFPGKARQVAGAVAAVAQIWGAPDDAQWPRSLEIRARFLERWREVIHAPAGTLTAAENVTTALYSVVGALPDRHLKGRCVLIAADCFPSLHFLLSGMAERRGFTLRTVPRRAGENWVRDEDFIAAWGPDVGVALLTWVTSTSSHRCDLRALVEHGRKMGTLVGADITQGVGILPFDLAASPPDFIVASTLKWLCGVAGAGILHVSDSLLPECRPELRGWFSQENPFAWELDGFDYARDARRFDHGTPSIFAAAACLPALEWHAQQESGALLTHNHTLTRALIEGCRKLGLELVSPGEEHRRGGSVMFRSPAGAPAPALVQALRERDIFVDCRGSTLRFSPGNVTTAGGIERLLAALHAMV